MGLLLIAAFVALATAGESTYEHTTCNKNTLTLTARCACFLHSKTHSLKDPIPLLCGTAFRRHAENMVNACSVLRQKVGAENDVSDAEVVTSIGHKCFPGDFNGGVTRSIVQKQAKGSETQLQATTSRFIPIVIIIIIVAM